MKFFDVVATLLARDGAPSRIFKVKMIIDR